MKLRSTESTALQKDASTDTYWVGTRNMGLFQCKLHDRTFVPIKNYTIPKKADRYSVYSLNITSDTVLAGTSHGLLMISGKGDSTGTMTHLWPQHGMGQPIVVRDLVRNSGHLYFSSPQGIMCLDSEQVKQVIPNSGMPQILPSLWGNGSTLIAQVADTLYTLDSQGHITERYQQTQSYDFLLANEKVYSLNQEEMNIAGQSFRLPSQARPSCHNLIANDPKHSMVLAVTLHHLLRVPYHHLQPATRTDHQDILLSCVNDKEDIFFLLGNTLFVKQHGDSVANERFQLPPDHHPTFMTCCDGYLYYVIGEKDVYRIRLDQQLSKRIMTLGNDVTALSSHNGYVYIGIRDSLLAWNGSELKPVRLHSSQQMVLCNPFVTTFYAHGDLLYFGTLNNGIFKGREYDFYRVDALSSSIDHRFVRDICVRQDTIYVLTHQQLWMHTADKALSIRAAGYNRLMANDNNVIAVSDYGLLIGRSNDLSNPSSICYQDWQFKPELCQTAGGQMIAVYNNSAVLVDDNLLNFDNQLHWIHFSHKRRLHWDDPRTLLACFAAFLIMTLICAALWHRQHTLEKKRLATLADAGEHKAQKAQREKEQTERLMRLKDRVNEQIDELQIFNLTDFSGIKQRSTEAMKSDNPQLIEQQIGILQNIIDNIANIELWHDTWGRWYGNFYLSQHVAQLIGRIVAMSKTIDRLDYDAERSMIDEFDRYVTSRLFRQELGKLLTDEEDTLRKIVKQAYDMGVAIGQTPPMIARRMGELCRPLAGDKELDSQQVYDLITKVEPLIWQSHMACALLRVGTITAKILFGDDLNNLDRLQGSLGKILEMERDPSHATDTYYANAQREFKQLVMQLDEQINKFYEPWMENKVDNELYDIIREQQGTSNKYKCFDGQRKIQVWGYLLVMLMCGTELKNKELNKVLKTISPRVGGFDSEKKRLIDWLATKNDMLKDFQAAHPTSIAEFILRVKKKETN